MKTRSNRRKKRGIKALFCFLLAAELTLGSLSTPAQAEASEITTSETGAEETSEPADTTSSSEKTDEESETGKQENGDTEPGKQEQESTEPGKQEQVSTEPEEPNPPADEPSAEEPPVKEPQKQCTCTTLCTEDSFDAECPVCRENPSLCTPAPQEETPVTVTAEAPQVALLSDSEEKPPAKGAGETFQDMTPDSQHLHYKVLPGGNVEVTHNEDHYASGFLADQTLVIPEKVTDENGNTYTVVGIGEAAFGNPDNPDNNRYGGHFSSVSFEKEANINHINKNAFVNCTSLTSIEIPSKITCISDSTFEDCDKLQTVTLPSTVTDIEASAFEGCTSLTEITLPANLNHLGNDAFHACSSLTEVTIPGGIETIDASTFWGCVKLETVTIGNGVKQINDSAFYGCTALKKIYIPSSVTEIRNNAFGSCDNLETVTILNSSVTIAEYVFANCYNLTSLYLAVKQDGPITLATTHETTFVGSPADPTGPDRLCNLTFLAEDGNALNASTYSAAKTDYDQADGTVDGKWYRWTIGEPPEPATYTVAIQAQLNGIPWNEFPWNEFPWNKVPWNESEHPKKTFALSKDGGKTYITDLTAEADGKYSITVADGEYGIYERIETPEQTAAREVSYQPTGMTVSRDKADAVIDYYTATFYDGSVLYDSTTDYPPQIVLKGTCVVEPLKSPTKDGSVFADWKTEDNGSTPFNFESPLIDEAAKATNIYASWKETTEEPVTYHIIAKAHEGGSISPEGDIEVTKGMNYTFTIKADADYRIKSVMEDDSIDRGARDSYTFLNVNKDHTIDAYFEETETGGGGTSPDNPGGSGGGGSSDPDDSDDDHSGGGSSDAGGSGGGSDAGSPGGGNSGGSTSDNGSGTGNSGSGISDGGSTGSTNLSTGSSLPEAGGSTGVAGAVSGAGASGSRPGEPKTGDASHLEVYASIAMIAGFVYLILYLMDGMKGMSEEEKDRRIASLLRWAKRGKAKTLRRYIAIAAVFLVLAYYHAFGKQAAIGWQKA